MQCVLTALHCSARAVWDRLVLTQPILGSTSASERQIWGGGRLRMRLLECAQRKRGDADQHGSSQRQESRILHRRESFKFLQVLRYSIVEISFSTGQLSL